MCVGCRKRDSAARLVRVVLADAGTGDPAVVVDTARRIPGRGAWLHLDLQCLDLAERRRAFTRALRTQGPVDARALREHVEAQEESRPRAAARGEA